jgi:hypothetical protein
VNVLVGEPDIAQSVGCDFEAEVVADGGEVGEGDGLVDGLQAGRVMPGQVGLIGGAGEGQDDGQVIGANFNQSGQERLMLTEWNVFEDINQRDGVESAAPQFVCEEGAVEDISGDECALGQFDGLAAIPDIFGAEVAANYFDVLVGFCDGLANETNATAQIEVTLAGFDVLSNEGGGKFDPEVAMQAVGQHPGDEKRVIKRFD